jgi:hypothetical protein
MRRYTKPTILILCLTALVAAAATDTNIDYMQVAEDIDIMARIIEKTLEGKFPDEYRASSLLFRGCQGIYLKGYGVVFMTSISFPVAEQAKAPQEKAPPDDLWQQTKYELKGLQVPGITYADIGGNYDSQKVAQLKEELVRLIGTYAPNIRQLSSQENIVIAVRGKPGLRVQSSYSSYGGYSASYNGGAYSISEGRLPLKIEPRRISVPTVKNVGPTEAVSTPTTTANISDGGAGGDTTLIVKVNKESIMAYKDGRLDFAGFMKQAEITQY